MKSILGILLIVAGLMLGCYVGIWWSFVGGIVDVITGIRAVDLDALKIAFGIAKVMFAGFIGYISALVLVIPGAVMIKLDE